jgi:SAM-dependent methyltransferase
VDLSVAALRQASQRIGDRGIYVLGDITNLPFAENSMEGVISLHTIYHVPRDQQATAFRELYRVLRPGGSAVVVYKWGRPRPLRWRELTRSKQILVAPWRLSRRAYRFLRSVTRRPPEHPQAVDGQSRPRLYVYGHSYRWFVGQDWPFEAQVVSWNMVTPEFRQKYIHERLLGRQILRLLRLFEERFPTIAGRIGAYPLIAIQKPGSPGPARS